MVTHTLKNGGGWGVGVGGCGGGGGGEAGVKLLTHLPTKAPYEADMTPEIPTKNCSRPTNVSKSVTDAS